MTGDEPPSPTDPDTPVIEAVSWALASGIGMVSAQLLTQRIAARHWGKIGNETPDDGKICRIDPASTTATPGARVVFSGLTAPTSPASSHLAASRPVTQLLPDKHGATEYAFGTTSLDDHARLSPAHQRAITGSCTVKISPHSRSSRHRHWRAARRSGCGGVPGSSRRT